MAHIAGALNFGSEKVSEPRAMGGGEPPEFAKTTHDSRGDAMGRISA
jgi:hypothetical protein